MLIEIRNLTKRFGRTVAVDDLSFDVHPGRVTGFLGPNGSGKSTTMRCMVGLDRPQAGGTTFDGRRYESIRRPLFEVGALFDAGYVHPARSGRNHLRWLAATNGIPVARADECLELVFLDGLSSASDVSDTSGRGVGMSAVKSIVEALGGSIRVRSELGHGTSFELCWPSHAAPARSRRRAAQADALAK